MPVAERPLFLSRNQRFSLEHLGSSLLTASASCVIAVGLSGCAHAHHADKYVYVTAKQTYLNDRFAAVSNRTATVENGDRLTVLERQRHAVKVRTASGAIGWIREADIADQDTADQFEALRKKHIGDPTVATATATNDVYLHSEPGRKTTHFFRLGENDTMSLLERASVVKPIAPGAAPAPSPGAAPAADEGPVMEDWWLVRDAKGDTGWIYSRMINVSAPDTLERYAEGQRIVGAYLLDTVNDPDSGMIDNGQTVTSIPEYVTVLSPYKAGLPYDFDQVRVFTWNLKKHRYETAFREHNIEGFLPVTISKKNDPYSRDASAALPLPAFTYRVLSADAPAPVPDPTTGIIKPGKTISKTYRLIGNVIRSVAPPGPAPAEAHPDAEPDKKGAKKKKR